MATKLNALMRSLQNYQNILILPSKEVIDGANKNFTNVLRLKRNNSDVCVEDEAKSSKRRRSNEYPTGSAILSPSNKCLFCNKQDLKVKGK